MSDKPGSARSRAPSLPEAHTHTLSPAVSHANKQLCPLFFISSSPSVPPVFRALRSRQCVSLERAAVGPARRRRRRRQPFLTFQTCGRSKVNLPSFLLPWRLLFLTGEPRLGSGNLTKRPKQEQKLKIDPRNFDETILHVTYYSYSYSKFCGPD